MLVSDADRKKGKTKEEHEDGKTLMESIYDSPAWRKAVYEFQEALYGGFSPFNLSLILNTDGVSPWQKRSIWPIVAQIANLPHSERIKPGWMPLLALIPRGCKSMDINSYYEPIVDELLHLQTCGMEFNVHRSLAAILSEEANRYLKNPTMKDLSSEEDREKQRRRRLTEEEEGVTVRCFVYPIYQSLDHPANAKVSKSSI